MPSGRRRPINISLLIPFLVMALVFGLLIWQKYQMSREVPSKPQVQQPSRTRTVVLFFVADGNRLAREAREIEPCGDTPECVKTLLDELFSGPMSDLDDALTEGAKFTNVQVAGDTATVELNRNFSDEHPSGSSAEMLAVYSIVDTICVNFPEISKVRLMLEGVGEQRLKHLDLADPLAPDYSLELVPPSPAAPAKNPPHTKKNRKQ
jgi:hypothetical protein